MTMASIEQIDYTALPVETKAGVSPRRIALYSATGTVVVVTGLVLWAVFFRDSMMRFISQDSSVAWVAAIGVISVLFTFIALWLILKRSADQVKVMAQFASQNGWQFEGTKGLDGQSKLPPDIGKLPGRQLYCISGQVAGKEFDLFAVQAVGRLPYGVSLAYATFLRTTNQSGDNTYHRVEYNAVTQQQVRDLFLTLRG